ncbi:GAP family protein [Microbacterium sp. H1-D42]|uniref:GAP family protein n=1 Tax=Microbacterium sp. H1-D42 TaxID=2925844 RepID=UPI001F53142F|nr:GAP family protein [Microbacterium sp. H1-D42]UNK72370.1 GAP family protein [Microbacterium sp. H1-D42]
MVGAVWQLLPVALGVMASPLAVLGLVGILLSSHARRNGTAYLLGWVIATTALLAAGVALFAAADAVDGRQVAAWVPITHAVIGAVCVLGAVWIFARARGVAARVAAARTPAELAAAAPQLPGLVRGVAQFTPVRSLFLGLGIFMNPMNISLVVAAALEIAHATALTWERTSLGVGFVVAAAAPVAIPVLIVLVRGKRADPMLRGLRAWMLKHNGSLSAGILMLVGILQLIKALQIWF